MRAQIITNDNQFGMTQDIAVLREALAAINPTIEVTYNHWQKPQQVPRGHYDLNIFGEFLNPAFYPQAKRNVFVPNAEWFWHQQHLHGVDQVWAKTHDCERIFKDRHREVKYLGWTSQDCLDASVPRVKKMVHLAGASSAKGTKEVIAAMRQLPQFQLTLVSGNEWGPMPPNVERIKWMEQDAFNRLRNEALIHLCPSSYEGFGHYLNEARAVGAVIITTNAEPMNELVRPDFGFGCKVAGYSRQNWGTHKHVDANDLVPAITSAMDQSEKVLTMIGSKARAAYLADRDTFTTNLKAVLEL